MQFYSATQWSKKSSVSISFIYVWTTVEPQVQELFSSQAVRFVSKIGRPETPFRHEQRKQRASAVLGSTNNTQNTFVKVNWVEHQKIVNRKKLGKRTTYFQK